MLTGHLIGDILTVDILTIDIFERQWIFSQDNLTVDFSKDGGHLARRSRLGTSALAQPKVFLLQDLGAILTLMKAITRAAMSESMWKLSATRAIELVR